MRQRQKCHQLYCAPHNSHNPHLHLPTPGDGRGMGEMKRGVEREEGERVEKMKLSRKERELGVVK